MGHLIRHTMAERVHLFTARNLLHATRNAFHAIPNTFRATRNAFHAVLLMSLSVSKIFQILSSLHTQQYRRKGYFLK